jgi:hypothetical protein
LITAIVILASLVLAAAFVAAWLLRPSLRAQVEQPKHWFQDQVREYDRLCRQRQTREEGQNDEPR